MLRERPSAVEVFLKAGEDKEITFENSPQSAIIIKKVDAETGEALEGIKFEVRYLSGATGTEGTVVGTYTTSKNGTITIAGLKPGVYSVAEVSSDSDHILDDTLKTVTLKDDNSVVTVEFTNAPLGGLLIKKMDAVTKEPLSDVIFKVTDIKGTVVGESNGEYRTDETGTIYIPQLMGGFIVQEIKTKDGYILDNTAKTIYIEKGRVYSMEFFNQPQNAFVIQKLDGETKAPLAGAVIKVTTVDDQYIGQYTTDESGIISINGLKPGTYKVQEISAPEGYNLDNTLKLVHLKQNEPQKLELYNYKKAALIIYKVDKKTQEPLEGAKFKVTEIDGTYVGEYITGIDGKITIPKLEPNWYVVTETAAPKGYNIDAVPSKNVQVKSGSSVTVKFENDKNATLRIVKTDIVTGKPMENVEFTIVRDDGKTYSKHYTNKLGEINLEYAFPAGTFLIRETNTLKGYALDTNVRKITLDWGDDKLIEWENYPLAFLLDVEQGREDNFLSDVLLRCEYDNNSRRYTGSNGKEMCSRDYNSHILREVFGHTSLSSSSYGYSKKYADVLGKQLERIYKEIVDDINTGIRNRDYIVDSNGETLKIAIDQLEKVGVSCYGLKREVDVLMWFVGGSPRDILQLQRNLNGLGIRGTGSSLKEDGVFGERTSSAFAQFLEHLARTSFKSLVWSTIWIDPLQTDLTGIRQNYKITKNGEKYLQLLADGRSKPVMRLDRHPYGKNRDFPHINVSAFSDSTPKQIANAAKWDHFGISNKAYEMLKNFDHTAKVIKVAGKTLLVAGVVAETISLGKTIESDLNDADRKLGKSTGTEIIRIIGSWTGSAIGAKYGAMAGAYVGTAALPGVGTAVGGIAGGLIGATALGLVGSYSGDLAEYIIDISELE